MKYQVLRHMPLPPHGHPVHPGMPPPAAPLVCNRCAKLKTRFGFSPFWSEGAFGAPPPARPQDTLVPLCVSFGAVLSFRVVAKLRTTMGGRGPLSARPSRVCTDSVSCQAWARSLLWTSTAWVSTALSSSLEAKSKSPAPTSCKHCKPFLQPGHRLVKRILTVRRSLKLQP